MLALAQRREIDAVLVTEISRWGRSTTDLLATLRELEARRVWQATRPHAGRLRSRIADEQVWMLEDEGTLAGILVLEDAEGGALLLDNIAVAPNAQGKGHGRTLVAFAETEARRRGHSQLQLYTHVLMTENLAIYSRLGFEENHRVTEKGYDQVYMTKRLT